MRAIGNILRIFILLGVVQLAVADNRSGQSVQGTNVSGPQSVVSGPAKISTLDGKTFLSVKILKVESDDLLIEYGLAGGGIGLARVGFTNLSETLQRQYGYTGRMGMEKAAVSKLREAAEDGDAGAQCNLGRCYDAGRGVPQNAAEAVKWYRRAAEQGNPRAEGYLGACYFFGQGVERNSQLAARWITKAAKGGDLGAQFVLGMCYRDGCGVGRNYAEAAKWFQEPAQQGMEDAQLELGKLYASGMGVPKNDIQAANWWRRAADQGYASAQLLYGFCWELGKGVPENDAEAFMWFSIAASQGNSEAKQARDSLADGLAPQLVEVAQKEAARFVPTPERAATDSEGMLPSSDIPTEKISAGTGFFVTDDGYLVTCEHVIHGATSFRVNSGTNSFPARLVHKDKTIDIALLKVDGSFRAMPVALEPQVKLGDVVFTIGFPNPDVQGVEPKLTRGEISSMAGIRDDPSYFQISVPVQPGNSGGALVDENGNVVGVVTMRLDDIATYEVSGALPQNVNYAVKGGLVRRFLDHVSELRGKLKTQKTRKNPDTASGAAESAAALVIAE